MRRILALISVTALMVALAAMPAMAQPLFTGGLANVTVTDVVDVNGNTITAQVPIGVAANLCDINVAILVEDLQDGAAECEATNESRAVNSLRGLDS